MTRRICTVRGLDHRGLPKWVIVEAASLHEAAARAMDEIRKDSGRPSDLRVTMHEPKGEWTVTEAQLLKYVSSFGADDNVGLRDVKRKVKDFLKVPE